MDSNLNLLEPLIDRAEQYGKTSLELIKLKSIDKSSDILAKVFSRLLFAASISLFAISLNIAIALWLGELMGKTYFGFIAVASFYALTALILFIAHPALKSNFNDSIITQLLS